MLQGPDGVRGRLLGGVQKSQVADKHHVTLVLYTESSNGRGIALLSNDQHAEALVIETVHRLKDPLAHISRQRPDSAVTLGEGTDSQHLLYSSFGHHLSFSGLVLYHGAQPPAGKVKGNLVYLHIVLRQVHQPLVLRFGLFRFADDGQIHEIFVAGLEVAVEIGVAQYPGVVLTIHIEMVLQNHLVLG